MSMTVRSVGWWVMLFMGIFLLFGSAGCAPTPPDLVPFMKQAAEVIAEKIQQEGILDKFAARAEMDHAVEPGVVVEVGLFTRVRVKGLGFRV
jgi:hypothetical protein